MCLFEEDFFLVDFVLSLGVGGRNSCFYGFEGFGKYVNFSHGEGRSFSIVQKLFRQRVCILDLTADLVLVERVVEYFVLNLYAFIFFEMFFSGDIKKFSVQRKLAGRHKNLWRFS